MTARHTTHDATEPCTRGEALFLAAVKGHDVDPAAVWWPMRPVGRGLPYRYVECAWCLMRVIERDTPDGVRYAGVALALRCRRQSAVTASGADSGGSTDVPMDLGAERALGMRSATGRDSDTAGDEMGSGSDQDGGGKGTDVNNPRLKRVGLCSPYPALDPQATAQ